MPQLVLGLDPFTSFSYLQCCVYVLDNYIKCFTVTLNFKCAEHVGDTVVAVAVVL